MTDAWRLAHGIAVLAIVAFMLLCLCPWALRKLGALCLAQADGVVAYWRELRARRRIYEARLEIEP